jgi:phosphate transport system permease protein
VSLLGAAKQEKESESPDIPGPSSAGDRSRSLGDRLFRGLTVFFAALVLLSVFGMLVTLLAGSWPALKTFGLRFLASKEWNPVTEQFGALAPLYGTVITSVIALLVGVPVSFGIALVVTELAPRWLKRPIGMLTAGLILAIMIIPFMAAVMRDVFETVPGTLRESAYALGCTTWEVVWRVVLPYTRVGVIGGVMLGLGRALGETMAVTFVIGNAHDVHLSLFMAGNTISSTLANEFTEAVTPLYTSSLLALGLVLFVLTFIVLIAARLMLMKMRAREGERT